MTVQETAKIMDVLSSAYPDSFKGFSEAQGRKMTELWASMFENHPVDLVARAVKSFIASDEKGFLPKIGQIMALVVEAVRGPQMTAEDAWTLILKALPKASCYPYAEHGGKSGAQVEFEKLPALVQKVVCSPTQLYDWSVVDGDVLERVTAPGFKRAFNARAEEERKALATPSDVREVIDGLADKMRLEDGESS